MPSISFKKVYFGTENSVYLPVNANVEVNILNLNFIDSFIFYIIFYRIPLLQPDSQMINTTVQ